KTIQLPSSICKKTWKSRLSKNVLSMSLVVCFNSEIRANSILYEIPIVTQEEIVNRAIYLVCKNMVSSKVTNNINKKSTQSKIEDDSFYNRNLIAYGYKMKTESTNSGIYNEPNIVNLFPNPIITVLKGKDWQSLLEIIGANAMLYLLSDVYLFEKLVNKCFIQLTGIPVNRIKFHSLKNHVTSKNISKIKHCVEKSMNLSTQAKAEKISSNTAYCKKSLYSTQNQKIFKAHILYSKPNRNNNGKIIFGLPKFHPFRLYNQDNFDKDLILKQIFCKYETDIPKWRYKKFMILVDLMLKLNKSTNYAIILQSLCNNSQKSSKVFQTDSKKLLSYEESKQQIPGSTLEKNLKRKRSDPTLTKSKKKLLKNPNNNDNQPFFIKYSTSYKLICRFIFICLKKIIPKQMIGEKNNFNLLKKAIKTFIISGKTSVFTLHNFLQKLKVSECGDWLQNNKPKRKASDSNFNASKRPKIVSNDTNINFNIKSKISNTVKHDPLHESLKKLRIYASVVFWVINDFVIPLCKANFYVTETEVFKNKTFFFRHDIWCKMISLDFKKNFFFLKPTSLTAQAFEKRRLGFSNMRLLPKNTGFRLLINYKHKSLDFLNKKTKNITNKYNEFSDPINKTLRPIFHILTQIKHQNPDCFGCSVFGQDSVYKFLLEYKLRLREKQKWFGKKKLFMVKVDISQAFTNIKKSIALEFINSLINEDVYFLNKYSLLKLVYGVLKPRYNSIAMSSKSIENFKSIATKQSVKTKNSIFINGIQMSVILKNEILELIDEHVNKNLIKFGPRYFIQTQGIPQGSILSPLLCNLYFGIIEKTKIIPKFDKNCLILRQMDDFLFISTKKEMAENFLNIIYNDLKGYGLKVNRDKTVVNFNTKVNGDVLNQIKENIGFPWSGLLLDQRNLSVEADYLRFGEKELRDGLTLDLSKQTELRDGLTLDLSKQTVHISQTGKIKVIKRDRKICVKETALEIGINKTVPNTHNITVKAILAFLDTTISNLLNKGNKANQSMAKSMNAKTKLSLESREASKTQANTAALTEIEPIVLILVRFFVP
ncbi:hypothetical protein BB561_002534, partial [Smittium simulii]